MTFTVGRGNHIGILWPLNIKNIGLLFPDDPPKLSLPIISYQGFEDFFFYLSYRVRYSQEQLREIIHQGFPFISASVEHIESHLYSYVGLQFSNHIASLYWIIAVNGLLYFDQPFLLKLINKTCFNLYMANYLKVLYKGLFFGV